MIRNGTAQDAFCLPLNVSPGLAVTQGWVQPLDGLIPDIETWKAGFPPGAFLEGINVFDGKTYGLPYTSAKVSSAHVLFNRKYMQAAGYDPETTPLTWTTFREAAKKITQAGNGAYYGFIIGGGQINRWQDTVRTIAQMAGASGGSSSFYSDLDFRTGELQYTSDAYIGAVELLPFYIWESVSGHPVQASGTTLLAVGYTVLFPSIAAYLCFNRAVELLGPNTAGLAIHLVPVFGSLLAILFLGEQPHLYHGIGIALIAAGIVLATRRRA